MGGEHDPDRAHELYDERGDDDRLLGGIRERAEMVRRALPVVEQYRGRIRRGTQARRQCQREEQRCGCCQSR